MVQTRDVTATFQGGEWHYDLPDGFVWAKLEGLSFFGTEMIDGVVHVRNKPKGWYRATHVFPTEAALWAAIPKPPRGFTLRQVVNGAFLPIDIGPSQAEVGNYLRQIETLSQ